MSAPGKTKSLINRISIGVLAAAVGVHIFFLSQPSPQRGVPDLNNAIPVQLQGFVVKDRPLGSTELVSGAVAKALNYDAFVHRSYRRGDLEIVVYIAYWGHGKMPTRDIASHTPDRCWTENGMTCRAARFHESVVGAEHKLWPAEWREFSLPGSPQSLWVYFWLRAGDENYDFGREFNSLMNPTEWLRSIWKNAASGHREHMFFRLSSNRPFETLRTDAGYLQILDSLAALGLRAESRS